MLKYSYFTKVYIACGYTDLRNGIDGLTYLVQDVFEKNVFEEGTLFLFCGRKKNRIKGLVWEGDGFLMLYKRLEDGSYKWPKTDEEVRQMSAEEYERLMSGLQIDPSIRKVYPKYAV